MMNFNDLKKTVPAAFTTEASPKLSNRYSFVPTISILESFDKDGWNIHSAKQRGNSIYGLHEIRLRKDELPQVGDSLFEVIVRNSHNGTTSFSVSSGLHRLVCSNGLTVPTSLAEALAIRHKNFNVEEVRKITDKFAARIPIIEESMIKMQNKYMTDTEKVKFVKEASVLRWKEGKMPTTISIEQILNPLRDGDKENDLWSVFNVIQEKFVRGGVGYVASSGRASSMRQITNIQKVNEINTKLWELAETYC